MTEIIWCLVIFAVAVLAYINCLRGEFVFDDLLILESNRHAKETKKGASFRDLLNWMHGKRALSLWTFRVSMVRHGMNTLGWHLPSVLLHALTSDIVFFILGYWFEDTAAGLGALIYTVHPLATAAVPYISSRSSMLSSLFHMLTLLAFLAGDYWLLITPITGYLGWKSKEEIINCLPVMAIVYWLG